MAGTQIIRSHPLNLAWGRSRRWLIRSYGHGGQVLSDGGNQPKG
jgi:hypothetical protein